MLESGHPPDDWDRLLVEARKEVGRLAQVVATASKVES
jgi:toxin YhaV